jgi:NADH-quinone oxidoreductase subunit L
MSWWVRNAWLIPFFPLLGAALAALGKQQQHEHNLSEESPLAPPTDVPARSERRHDLGTALEWLRARPHLPVVSGIALAFLVSLGTYSSASTGATTTVYRWLAAGELEIPIIFRVDGLTTMMLSMVTLVSFLVAVFAIGYMAGDPACPRFFALIGLFVFSMTGLVLSNNYVVTYAFWEGVGVCSYLLVGFWHTRPAAASAAIKAFLVNRLGDLGFAVAIFWLWSIAPQHDVSYETILNEGTLLALPRQAVAGIALLFFWAATAKSAQIPLYVWLPDAMEGPTPVSALIHAATMVTAGVYLIARSMLIVAHAPWVQLLIATIGCGTALLAAAIAVTQPDLKRVLAYSTISQLGYMFMALGAGVGNVAQLAVVAAMFHLFTHAFFKALLFLAAGSVMHATGGVIDMRLFGGLRRRLPYTCWTFAVGGLALAGIPPLAGFFSKDEILLALSSAVHAAHDLGWGWVYGLVYWIALFTAFLTAVYTGRAFFMTFWGPEKLPGAEDAEAHDTAGPAALDPAVPDHAAASHLTGSSAHNHAAATGHESPAVMTYPLLALAGCTVFIGAVCLIAGPFGGTTEWFAHHLHATVGFEALDNAEHSFGWLTALLGSLAGLLGIGLSYLVYGTRELVIPVTGRLARLYDASLHKFYVDEFYVRVIVRPLRWAARACEFLDSYLVDRLVVGLALLPRLVARGVLAPNQNGLVQFYAAASALTLAVLLLLFVLF